jgi:hypothetical protein
MADPQTSSATPDGSLPPTLLTPPDGGLTSGLLPPSGRSASTSLPQSYFQPPVSLGPQPTPAPQPAPPPAPAPAVAPTPPVTPPATTAPSAQQPTATPPTHWRAIGDSIAHGYQEFGGAGGTGVQMDPANRTVDAAGGRPPAVVLDYLKSLPDGSLSGQNIIFSTGVSNNPGQINLVPAQLAELKRLGATNVKVVGVGDQAGDEGGHHYNLGQYNDQIAKDASDAGLTFGGALPAIVHPAPGYYRESIGTPGKGQPPGTAKTISDVTATIQKAEGGGDFILFGHEGTPYDPKTMPTKPPNENGSFYGFPDWAGGRGSGGDQTHAAGGAQWEPDTWQRAVNGYVQAGLANQLGHTPDFRNPADQKAVFNYWAARRYRELTGRDIVADANAGHVDWAALGPEWESLKNGLPGGGGGGTAGMTSSNTQTYQDWRRSMEEQRQTLADESADQMRRLGELEAGSPEQRALADQLLRKQLQMMDRYEQMIAHPPTQKPADILGNFGSIATLIGIFGGRFAHRPMVASLNAAGAAMQAMNDNDAAAYKNAFDTWKIQTDMTSKLIGMESDTYKGIMDDQHKTMDEKIQEMKAAADIYHNRLLGQQLEAGEYEKALEIPNKLAETQKNWTEVQKNLIELNAQRDLQAAVAADDQAYLAAHPEAGGIVPPGVHADNLARRTGQLTKATTKTAAELAQEEAVTAAVDADDQKWLADHKDAKSVPADVHLDNLARRTAQMTLATKSGGKPPPLMQITWGDGRTAQAHEVSAGHWVDATTGADIDVSGATSIVEAKSVGPPATPQAVEYWANVIERGGALPPGLARTKEGAQLVLQLMKRIPNDAVSPEDFVVKHATVKADQTSLTNMTKMRDAAVSFEETAKLNFDKALSLKTAVPDWGPFINRWIMEGETMTGDTSVPPYVAALLTAATEYAKVMSGSTGAQGSTVDARREAAERISPYLNSGQIDEVVKVLKADMDNRQQSLDVQVDDIKKRIGAPAGTTPQPTPTPTTAAPAGAVPVPDAYKNDPDGTKYNGGKYIKRGEYMVPQ